jgi:hypothetical protein
MLMLPMSSFSFSVLETPDVKKHEIILVSIKLCPQQRGLTQVEKKNWCLHSVFFVLEIQDVKKHEIILVWIEQCQQQRGLTQIEKKNCMSSFSFFVPETPVWVVSSFSIFCSGNTGCEKET